MDKKESGALCACITLATVNERVENKRTSPDWFWGEGAALEGVFPEASGDEGDGTGEG